MNSNLIKSLPSSLSLGFFIKIAFKNCLNSLEIGLSYGKLSYYVTYIIIFHYDFDKILLFIDIKWRFTIEKLISQNSYCPKIYLLIIT